MNTQKTGGPAFPRPFSSDDTDPDITYPAHTGMTLRDYFAAKAMNIWTTSGLTEDARAKRAYEMADAMLKARES